MHIRFANLNNNSIVSVIIHSELSGFELAFWLSASLAQVNHYVLFPVGFFWHTLSNANVITQLCRILFILNVQIKVLKKPCCILLEDQKPLREIT